MRKLRNSDEAFRRLHRQVAGGDTSVIPALARAYARQGSRPISDAVLRDVVAAFENMERGADSLDGPADILLLFTDMDDYHECDENGAVNADVGYIRGVADASGLTFGELWALSETARGGAGARRVAEAGSPRGCSRCGRITPVVDLTEVQSDPDDPMATESVCASCWDIMREAGDIISPARSARLRGSPPVTTCANCNADLTVEDSVAMTVQPGNGRVLTRLDTRGGLVDVDNVIAHGHEAGAECAACGENYDT